MPGLTDVRQLLAQGDVTCALVAPPGQPEGGSVTCWGPVRRPARVAGLEGVRDLALAGETACALQAGGHLACWTVTASTPRIVPRRELRSVVGLSGGGAELCARLVEGAGQPVQVRCFQAHPAALAPRLPVELDPELQGARAVAVGSHHRCGLLPAGQVICTGSNDRGQLGSADTRAARVTVTLPGKAVALAASGSSTCAALASGQVHCWGDNSDGQVDPAGASGAVDRSVASPFRLGGVKAGAVALGAGTGCAVAPDGGVRCWGRNDLGQLGDGRFGRYRNPPVTVRLDRPGGKLTAHGACFDDRERTLVSTLGLDALEHRLVFCTQHSYFEFVEAELRDDSASQRCASVDLLTGEYRQVTRWRPRRWSARSGPLRPARLPSAPTASSPSPCARIRTMRPRTASCAPTRPAADGRWPASPFPPTPTGRPAA